MIIPRIKIYASRFRRTIERTSPRCPRDVRKCPRKKISIGATKLVRGDGCPRHLQAKERPTSNLVFLVVFTIPIGCPREVRCPRNVRGVFWLHVFMTFWMQHLTWRFRSFCIALACSLGVFLPWRKLCFSSANGATQSNCSIKQRLCSKNPMWNSCSRFPSRAWRIERFGLR